MEKKESKYTALLLDIVKSVNNLGHKSKIYFTLVKKEQVDEEPVVMIIKRTLATGEYQVYTDEKVRLLKLHRNYRLYQETFSLKVSTYITGYEAVYSAAQRFPELFVGGQKKIQWEEKVCRHLWDSEEAPQGSGNFIPYCVKCGAAPIPDLILPNNPYEARVLFLKKYFKDEQVKEIVREGLEIICISLIIDTPEFEENNLKEGGNNYEQFKIDFKNSGFSFYEYQIGWEEWPDLEKANVQRRENWHQLPMKKVRTYNDTITFKINKQ